MEKETEILCEKCGLKAEYVSPAKLCDEHWLEWWNEVDEDVCIGHFADDFAFLSNFYESPITHEGIFYDTVEHFYQAQKTLDRGERKKVATARSPGAAKRMGKKLKLRKDWESVKVEIMRQGLKRKFTRNSLLGNMLVATHPAKLEEGNWWGDHFWGVDHKTRTGQNWLGRLLMERREELMRVDEEKDE